jgi:methionyl-tRNA formyltransferase
LRISILCSDPQHPISDFLADWIARHKLEHQIDLVHAKAQLSGGDILFLISCHEMIQADVRGLYNATLVIHASDLPLGRGWSPHIWQVLEKKTTIKVTLLEAADVVDSGDIWSQTDFELEGHETFDEINSKLFAAEIRLMDFAVVNFGKISPRRQDGRTPTMYRKRTPTDSRIDPAVSLADQFDLLRVADPSRFPAFFDFRGHRYFIQITKDTSNAKK